MSIASLLSVQNVFTEEDISSKKRLLEYIAKKAAAELSLSEKNIFNSLIERERLGSTGLGQGFSVPHARIDELDKTHACFIKLLNPIKYDAPDQLPVDLIFVLFVPQNSTQEHLTILANLAKIFSQKTITEKIRNTQSAEDIINLIQQAEDNTLDNPAITIKETT